MKESAGLKLTFLNKTQMKNSIACKWQYSPLPDRLSGSDFQEVVK